MYSFKVTYIYPAWQTFSQNLDLTDRMNACSNHGSNQDIWRINWHILHLVKFWKSVISNILNSFWYFTFDFFQICTFPLFTFIFRIKIVSICSLSNKHHCLICIPTSTSYPLMYRSHQNRTVIGLKLDEHSWPKKDVWNGRIWTTWK